jgi:hypothetical protein
MLLLAARWESHEGYFGPVLSPDGRLVYAMVRRTAGPVWLRGFFESPTGAFPVVDRVSLVRIDVKSGALEVLETWPSTPFTRRVVHASQGDVFNVLRVDIRPDESGAVRYIAQLDMPATPVSDVRQISGVWTDAPEDRQRRDWQHVDSSHYASSDPVLVGDIEVFAVPGPASFPSALVLLDHASRTVRPVAETPAYRSRYASGVPIGELLAASSKPETDRLNAFKRRQAELVGELRARGASEAEAIVQSYRTLEDEGYLPRSPRIVAHRLGAPDLAGVSSLPVFEIADAEMASGIFRDIEGAINSPGVEVNKSPVSYVSHRDYSNSRRLNDYIAGGGQAFVVRYRGVVYHIEIRNMKR